MADATLLQNAKTRKVVVVVLTVMVAVEPVQVVLQADVAFRQVVRQADVVVHQEVAVVMEGVNYDD